MNSKEAHADGTVESLLADVVDEVTQRLNAGEPITLDQYQSQYPEIAEMLAGVWEALTLVRQPEVTAVGDEVFEGLHRNGRLGDFHIVRELGRGGMGVVYEAEQISLGRRVALKVLPLAATLSPQQLERFKNEARAAATLKHPHIVGVYSVGVERGVHYYAMELVEGRSLAQVVLELRDQPASSEPPPGAVAPPGAETTAAALSTVRTTNPKQYFRHIAKFVGDAADALDYAHNRGVLHRDIKPANLLIDASSHLWITDFGLARLEADAGITLTGDMVGTLRYMSPEQAAGKTALVDYRSDIHALGATLFELLALRPAFPGDDRAQLLRHVAETTPPPLRQVVPRIPVDLETIVAQAMEKDPADRYQSAGDMAADLRAFVEHRAIAAKPPALAARAQKWMRRHVALVTLALATLVLLTALLGIALASINRARSQTIVALEDAQDSLQFARLAVDQMYTEVATEWLADDLALTPTQRGFLEKALRIYQRLANEARSDPQSQWEAGTSYGRVARIQHRLGQYRQAASAYERAIAKFQPLLAAQFGNADHRAELAAAYQDFGRLHATYEELPAAAAAWNNAHAALAPLVQEFPQEREFKSALAVNELDRSELLLRDGNADQSERMIRDADQLFADLPAGGPDEVVPYRLGRLRSQTALARVLRLRGELVESEKLVRQAIGGCRVLADDMPDSRQVRKMQVAAWTELADIQVQADRLEEAYSTLSTALEIAQQSLRGKTPPSSYMMLNVKGEVEWGRYAEPEPFREYVEIQIRLGTVAGRRGRFYESQQLLADAVRTAGVLTEIYKLPRFMVVEANACACLATVLRDASQPDADAMATMSAHVWHGALKSHPHLTTFSSGTYAEPDLDAFLRGFPEQRTAVTAETLPVASPVNLACLSVALGVAWYRHDSMDGAISFFDDFADPDSGGDSYAWFYLAMALERHGDHEQALLRNQQAVEWMQQHKPDNAELRELQVESASVLGLVTDAASSPSTTPPSQP